MKKLLLTLLFTASCCANTNNPIQTELDAKQAQLSLLSEQVMKKNNLLDEISCKIQKHLNLLMDAKKQHLTHEMSEEELFILCKSEMTDFMKMAYDTKHKITDLLFDETIYGESTRLLKFYLMNYETEYYVLQNLIRRWATLNDEILSIGYHD